MPRFRILIVFSIVVALFFLGIIYAHAKTEKLLKKTEGEPIIKEGNDP